MQIFAPLTSEAIPILQKIELASSLQIPSFHIIGLPAPEVMEARERVRAAVEASDLEFPRRRIVVNLSPASVRKRGTGLDLGIALSLLLAGLRKEWRGGPPPERLVAWGELGLQGHIRPVGQLTRALFAAWAAGASHFLLGEAEAQAASDSLRLLKEAATFPGRPPLPLAFSSLGDAWQWLSHGGWENAEPSPAPEVASAVAIRRTDEPALLALPPTLERMVGVAASGDHHLLLLGPRGTGKSHALEWLVALQPPLSPSSRVHHALIRELCAAVLGAETSAPAAHAAPASSSPEALVRRVSSHVRPAALIGSASPTALRPGEFSLAHGGLLLADELPEWSRDSREAFREPLERGKVLLTRLNGSTELPARFTLAANGNLCPCGGWPPGLIGPAIRSSPSRNAEGLLCHCSQVASRSYLARLSGPVLDRLDLVVLLANISAEGLPEAGPAPAQRRLRKLRSRVEQARRLCVERWQSVAGQLDGPALAELLSRHPEWQEPLRQCPCISLRSRHRLLRVALTLSAWDHARESERHTGEFTGPEPRHFLEASLLRPEALGIF